MPAFFSVAVISIVGLALSETSVSVLIVFALLCVMPLVFTHNWKLDSKCIYWIGFASSIIVAVVLFFAMDLKYGKPYYKGGSDDLSYERDAAATVARLGVLDYGGIRGKIVPVTHNSVGYVYFVSLLYRGSAFIGGYHTMFPRMVNCVLVGLLGVMTFQLAKKLGLSYRRSFAAGLVVSVFPLISYNAAFVFRDVIIALAVAATVNLWTAPKRMPARKLGLLTKILYTVVMAAAIFELREEHGIVILMVGCVGSLWSYSMSASSLRGLYSVAAVLGIAVAMIFASSFVRQRSVDLAETHERYSGFRAGSTRGLSNYVFRAKGPIKYPLRVGYALVSPLPNLNSLDLFWMSSGTIAQVLYLPFFFLGARHAVKNPRYYPLLLAFSALFAGVAFFTFQYRQMVQYLPFGVILTFVGYEIGYSRRKEIRRFSVIFGILLVLAYFILKLA